MNNNRMNYTEVRVLYEVGNEIKEHTGKAPTGMSIIYPSNNAWSYIDITGKSWYFNWSCVITVELTQKEE